MTFLLDKLRKTVLLALLVIVSCVAFAELGDIPEKPNPPRLVNDLANIIPNNIKANLERELIAFNKESSTQIVVVTVKTLNGRDKAEFTYTLGEKWGVGQTGKDNGIVIMVKPKEIDGRGEAFIATGYGVEGAVTDATASVIVQKEMIPFFKQRDYASGILAAVSTIKKLTYGEFDAEEYKGSNAFKKIAPKFFFIFIIIGFILIMKIFKTRSYAQTNSLGFWAAWSLLAASSRSHGGHYGGFSSGGGSFGGGGGFSGFGGGSFGGGGAGGSW